jgi:hypothetical protein
VRGIALHLEPRLLNEARPHRLSDWLAEDGLVFVTEDLIINEDVLSFSFVIHGNDLNAI